MAPFQLMWCEVHDAEQEEGEDFCTGRDGDWRYWACEWDLRGEEGPWDSPLPEQKQS